jgi:hypothetical protein
MITLTEKTFLQPTLSLFLGGCGVRVGTDFLSILESLPPSHRGLVEPYFIDSQQPALRDHARSRHYCYQNLGDFFEPIYREFSEQRFPENLGVSPVMNSSEGCGVTRIFGAASLVACRDNFLALIDQAAGRLRANRESETQPLQVFITASACGGTGAGMVIDAAALVRHYFRSRGENPRILLFLMGPSSYVDDPQIRLTEGQIARMRASTYALLKELHHFAQGKPFLSAYRLRDQVIDISNERDDDRLFDWVYYVDGRPEGGTATRTVDEVTWTIAEAQMHLCVTEVGRKVAESMPNQREERLRVFPLNVIHPDNKTKLTIAAKKHMADSSRRTFLAGIGVRNVRFPLDEIKHWLRWNWVVEALQKALQRNRPEEERPLVQQYEELLGLHGDEMLGDGLLADLELTRDRLLKQVKGDADPDGDVPRAPQPGTADDALLASGDTLVGVAEAVVADIREGGSSLVNQGDGEGSELPPASEMVQRALRGLGGSWRIQLADGGTIATRLWELAWNPASGHGLHFLDGLVTYMAERLTTLALKARTREATQSLEARASTARSSVQKLRKQLQLEERARVSRAVRGVMKKLGLGGGVHGQRVTSLIKTVTRDAAQLRQAILSQRRAQIGNALAGQAWLDAAAALKKWRDDVLAPAITAAENALTFADAEAQRARVALGTHEGTNARGRWVARTTVQLASDELLAAIQARLSGVRVEDLVLAALQGEGIPHEGTRLHNRNIPDFPRETATGVLLAHVAAATRQKLTFLDDGWQIKELGEELKQMAAKALDDGAEPLVSFSRPAVGVPLKTYLLRPRSFLAPTPFGQDLGRTNTLDSIDPLQLSVLTFTYGIPPNTLGGMQQLFEDYRILVGDAERYRKDLDRYPMHVFREAAETFDEVHSPISFDPGDGAPDAVVQAAGVLWNAGDGGARLSIRNCLPAEAASDWNVFIELTEQILHYLRLNPEEASRLFDDDRFLALERLYNSRRFRAPETYPGSARKKGGNGR